MRVRRVPREGLAQELNGLRRAMARSREQLRALQAALRPRVPARVLEILAEQENHLRDAVFLSDVENLVLGEQLPLGSAIAKVVGDVQRISAFGGEEASVRRARRLVDVGGRLLSVLQEIQGDEGPATTPTVLVTRDLALVDMFDREHRCVDAILCEANEVPEGLANLIVALEIPTLAGVVGLLEHLHQGDEVEVRAAEPDRKGDARVLASPHPHE